MGLRRTEGGLDEHTLVELFYGCGNAESRHGIKYAQWVTAVEQFVRVSFVKCAGNEEDNIVNHVRVARRSSQPASQTNLKE